MAISKSTRSAQTGGRSIRLARKRASGASGFARSSTGEVLPERWVGHVRQLTVLVPRLRAIYGIAVAAQLALRQQAAEHDPELADCLRVGVCDPIAAQVQVLEGIVEGFCRAETGSRQ